MASRVPSGGLDSVGSFRHSQRYAATAARYTKTLERERSMEEARASTSSGSDEERLLTTSGAYIERQRVKNEKYKSSCARWLCAVCVMCVFAAVAVLGYGHFSGKFDFRSFFASEDDSSSTTLVTTNATNVTTSTVATSSENVTSVPAAPAATTSAKTSTSGSTAPPAQTEATAVSSPPPAVSSSPPPAVSPSPPPAVSSTPPPAQTSVESPPKAPEEQNAAQKAPAPPMKPAQLAKRRHQHQAAAKNHRNDISAVLLGAAKERIVDKFCLLGEDEER